MNWKREESGKELAPSPHAACQCDGWITYAQLNAAEKFVERWLRSFQSLPMCLYASLLSAHTRIHIVAVRGIFILRIRFPKLFVTLPPPPLLRAKDDAANQEYVHHRIRLTVNLRARLRGPIWMSQEKRSILTYGENLYAPQPHFYKLFVHIELCISDTTAALTLIHKKKRHSQATL